MTSVQLTLIGKPDCHLCEDAKATVALVQSECEARGVDTTLTELDILQDQALARKHSENIPVVLINGKRHAIWRVDHDRLTAAIEKAARRWW